MRWSPALPLLLVSLGCGNSPIGPRICDRPATDEPVPVCEGHISGNSFSSLTSEGELLAYRGGAFYRVFHGLGVVPNYPRAYLSFSRYIDAPVEDGLPRSVAPAAGNQFEVKALTDEYIDFVNGTCDDNTFIIVETEAPSIDTAPIQGDLTGCADLRASLAGDGGASSTGGSGGQ